MKKQASAEFSKSLSLLLMVKEPSILKTLTASFLTKLGPDWAHNVPLVKYIGKVAQGRIPYDYGELEGNINVFLFQIMSVSFVTEDRRLSLHQVAMIY